MARKKIREYHAKKAMSKNAPRVTGREMPLQAALVHPDVNYETLLKEEPWLLTTPLVVKPDMLFGQRGKHNLVLLNANFEEAKAFALSKMGTKITVNGVEGELTHFLMEPFLAHDHEFYLSIHTERDANVISFSVAGGVEVEDNWDTIKTVRVGVESTMEDVELSNEAGGLLEGVEAGVLDATKTFIQDAYALFEDLDFTNMEMNPFTFSQETGTPIPLDFVGVVDDTAMFQNARKWDELEFPNAFGVHEYAEEKIVRELDERTGASLKLTVLNPEGLIWNFVAGGGASVIFADTVNDLGFGEALGNYGEYSGAPSAEFTASYGRALLDVATRAGNDGKKRALVVGGAIANFTDVAKTFSGIIHALQDYEEQLKAAGFKVFVRRGGPNFKKGLEMMRNWGKKSGIETVVYGPETSMTRIVPLAIEWVQS